MEQLKELRELTGVSMTVCKKALDEADGNIKNAVEVLRKKGEAKAVERSERSTGQGVIATYVHSNNKIGVMVQLGCETDFVAKNEEFQQTAKDIAMHVAAMNPLYLNPEDVPAELVEKEKEIWHAQLQEEGKKEEMMEKIMEGKEKKFREEVALTKQLFVKDNEMTVEKLVLDLINKMGENIKIVRFCRYSI